MTFASAVGEYFTQKSITDWVLFVITIVAFIEWSTFMVINVKTFMNVLRNPDKTTGVGRTVFVMVLYVAIRCMFLPFYVAGASINIPIYGDFQPILYKVSAVILTVWWNMVILLPCITVWYSRVRYGIGNKALPGTREEYNFIIILPVYNETLQLLVEGVDSMLKSEFPKHLMQIHVAFDNDDFSKLYLDFAEYYKLEIIESASSVSTVVNGVTVWVHRFPHGGKRLTQAKAWEFVKDAVKDTNTDRTIVLFTDSDNYMYNNALRNLAYNFERNTEKLAFAGYMTCMSSGWGALNPWRLLQDTEYVGGEMNRAFELLMGTVNCLPGGFTAMRYSAFDSVADKYFTTLADDTITDYHRNYLGEDRYLTHIMHQYFPRHSMGFCPSARCKTDPPTALLKLVQQRRRWYLGALSNEAYMFTDKLIWKKYKVMVVYKLMQLCLWRSFTISQFILAILMFKGMDFKSGWSGYSSQVLAMAVPLFLSWILISITGIKLGHYKVIFVYPFSHIPQTIIALLVDWKVVFSLYERSWGGARMVAVAEDVKADEKV